jgi:alpha-glucosidase
VTYLHDHNQSYIMMVDPPVSVNDSTSYDRGIQDDVFFKNSDGSVYLGGMWPGVTTWVDWFHPNAQDFWTAEVTSFFDADTGVDVDAIWIDMNEVSHTANYKPETILTATAGKLLSGPLPRPIPVGCRLW